MSVTRTDISTHSRKERSFSVKPTSSNLGWRSMTPKISEGAGVGGVGSAAQVTGAPRGSNTPKSVKLLLLVVLCLQNAVYTMLRRYSVGIREEKWSYSSVLMMGEFIKLAVSTFMSLVDNNSSSSSVEGRTGLTKLWWLLKASPPMAVPAVVYWLMNLLSYVAIKRVDASTFTVCAQLKILTTAVFSVVLMGRHFHPRKWRALLLLVLGVALVSNGSVVASDDDPKEVNFQYFLGVAAVITEVTLSGFVSVFFEKVLKSRVVDLTVWDRNFQLAMYSILFYFPLAIQERGGVFNDWTVNAVVLAVLGSAGGLLVAFTTKYTDAVLKTFATSGAIIVTAVAGHILLASPLDIPIGIGACCTVLSLLNYSEPDAPPARADVTPGLANVAQKAMPTQELAARNDGDGEVEEGDSEAATLLVSHSVAQRDSAV